MTGSVAATPRAACVPDPLYP